MKLPVDLPNRLLEKFLAAPTYATYKPRDVVDLSPDERYSRMSSMAIANDRLAENSLVNLIGKKLYTAYSRYICKPNVAERYDFFKIANDIIALYKAKNFGEESYGVRLTNEEYRDCLTQYQLEINRAYEVFAKDYYLDDVGLTESVQPVYLQGMDSDFDGDAVSMTYVNSLMTPFDQASLKQMAATFEDTEKRYSLSRSLGNLTKVKISVTAEEVARFNLELDLSKENRIKISEFFIDKFFKVIPRVKESEEFAKAKDDIESFFAFCEDLKVRDCSGSRFFEKMEISFDKKHYIYLNNIMQDFRFKMKINVRGVTSNLTFLDDVEFSDGKW